MIKANILTKIIRKYSIFFWLILAVTTAVVALRPEVMPYVRFQAFIFLTIAYLAWALVHHIIDKTISLEIVIEYLLTATLAIVILYSLLI